MGINSRFTYAYRDNASKGHKKIGEILRTSPYFKNYLSYQEWPVSKVNPNWKSNREHYDWVIPTLKIVIEFHGEQHAKPIQFGDMTAEDAIDAFKAQKIKDYQKEAAAVAAGWTYIIIWYHDTITDIWLLEEYKKRYNNTKPIIKAPKWQPEKDPEKLAEHKKQVSEYRKQRYQRQKEYKKSLKDKK